MSTTKEEALKHLDDAKNIWNALHQQASDILEDKFKKSKPGKAYFGLCKHTKKVSGFNF